MHTQRTTTWAAIVAMSGLFASTAVAQGQDRNDQPQESRQGQDSERQQDQRRTDRQQGDRQQGDRRLGDRRQGDRQQRNRDRERQLVLDSWIRVAYDYDGDDQWDAIEYVFGYDLAEAQRASRERDSQQGRSQRDGRSQQAAGDRRGGDRQRGQRQAKGSQRQRDLRGTIERLSTRSYAGVDEPHVFARVQTDDGRTARVDLGPRSQVRRADLQRGDHVTLTGCRGSINGEGTFITQHIRGQGGTTTSIRRDSPKLQRIEGRLTGTRTVRFQELDQPHVIALVQPDRRETPVLVDLGPRSQVEQLELQEGDDVTVMAAPGTIQRQRAMFAESVRNRDGKTITIEQADSRQRSPGERERSSGTRRRGTRDE